MKWARWDEKESALQCFMSQWRKESPAKMSAMYQGRDLRSGCHVLHSSRKAQSHLCHPFQDVLASTRNWVSRINHIVIKYKCSCQEVKLGLNTCYVKRQIYCCFLIITASDYQSGHSIISHCHPIIQPHSATRCFPLFFPWRYWSETSVFWWLEVFF